LRGVDCELFRVDCFFFVLFFAANSILWKDQLWTMATQTMICWRAYNALLMFNLDQFSSVCIAGFIWITAKLLLDTHTLSG